MSGGWSRVNSLKGGRRKTDVHLIKKSRYSYDGALLISGLHVV